MRLPFRKPGKYSQIKQDPHLTAEKLGELQVKLDGLKKIRPQAAIDVARLAELGDFSENVEYQLAKGRLRGINQRILELEYQINNSVIISTTKSNTIQIGNTVTISDGKTKITYQILGSSETNPKTGIISHLSPLGAALIGHRVGDKMKLRLASNETEYLVVAIGQ